MEKELTREEQAKRDVGNTEISKINSYILCALFLFLVILIPLLQGIHELDKFIQGKEKTLLPSFFNIYTVGINTVKKLFTGDKDLAADIIDSNNYLLEGIIRYEDDLENDSLFRNTIIPPAQFVFASVFGLGNEKAILGRDGWLFYEPGIRYLTSFTDENFSTAARSSSKANTVFIEKKASPLQAIIDFNKQLRDRNIKLILLPIPVKPMFYPEKISSRLNNNTRFLQNPYYEKFKLELEKENILIMDAARMLEEMKKTFKHPIFLKTDSHWRPETVAALAESLARYIENHVDLSPRNPYELKTRELEISNLGDIANMLFINKDLASPYREKATIRQILAKGNEPWSSDRNAEVLFLGDSFANIYSLGSMGWGESAGLVEQLSFFLNRPLDRINQNDDGAYATRQSLQYELSRGRDRLENKKVVIWEFAVRELVTGDWKKLDLKFNGSKDGGFFTPPSGKDAIATGIIFDVSTRPIPGTTPYRDHIMSLHLVDVAIDGEAAETKKALVYVFSMKDNIPTAAANYRVGEKIAMRLKNWYDVYDKYSGINRSEIDNEELLLEDPAWGEEIIK